ncbi:MAG: glucose 1-dehydrogenase [Candidatus Obscuribacterales bacterium]|jgi:3-oxoacyl-[acyl-carrier protein] reductase
MTAVQEQIRTGAAKRLEGKVALVTGGSRGIGAAIALKLAAEGASVALSYASNKDAADKVVAKITALGSKAVAVKANVTSVQDSAAVVAETIKTFGDLKIDILVNNAGVFEMGPIDAIDAEQFDRLFDVNVKGAIVTTIAALPHMNDGGRIINISSGAADATMAGASLYSATKSALDTLSRIWAQDLGKRQITVNSVSPGVTVTDMFKAGIPEEGHQYMIDKTALGRLGQPEDIADVVAFVASGDARWITGQVINVDGGIVI